MKISEIISFLETVAPPVWQEQYDNAGLLTGQPGWECSGILCCLDATEEVILEAIANKTNLVIAHHPIIFKGLKKINGKNYVERAVITAIKNDIAIYAIHTNLDNVIGGVNGKIAEMLGLTDLQILSPKPDILKKLFTFAPTSDAERVRQALFDAGGGQIGHYSECSFNTNGIGTFKAGEDTDPYVGKIGELHQENETRIEVVFPSNLESKILTALLRSHPYEEPAFDLVALSNLHQAVGSGLIGHLPEADEERAFLGKLKSVFGSPLIRHSRLNGRKIKKVAVCGGAGSFLVFKALAENADAFVTADMKYHEFFDAEDRMLIADIGHYESEQFTISLLTELLEEKFPTFAVLKTAIMTNPVHYF